MIHFHNPFYLLGLLLVALLYFFLGRREKPSILYSDTSWLGIKPLNKFYANLSEYLLLIVLAFIFLALTRPQRGYESEIIEKKGIDIVLTLDVSGSMRAVDFKPNNRLTVAKKLASEFVQKRAGDRIGLVAYAREALIQSPLTLDHKVVKDLIESLDFGMLEDGTAIGMGISFGTFLFSNSTSNNKVMILLTDGINNAGKIDPETAAKNASDAGIKIYAIGIGKRGEVPYPVRIGFGGTRYVMTNFEINEEGLRKIANETGGEYFRATSPEALKNIYQRIDKMEKTTFKVERIVKYKERVDYVFIPAILLFLIFFTDPIVSRKIP